MPRTRSTTPQNQEESDWLRHMKTGAISLLVAAEKYGKFTAGVRAAAEKYIWQIHRRTHMRRPALRKKSLING
jgi:hypothetical protein